MKKFILIFLLVILISGCSNNIKQVCFEKNCFNVEIADSDEKREIGLMNRSKLDLKSGMLFIFEEEDYYSFWMKNTLIPLDIIWMDSQFNIVFIKENFNPCTNKCDIITPDKKAKYVLEINSGLVKELNIKTNDELRIN